MKLALPGHTWSQLVTTNHSWSHGLKHLLGHTFDNLAVRWGSRAADHIWSQVVTTCHSFLYGPKHFFGHTVDNLAARWNCRAAGHIWSHLVTPGHKTFLGHRWSLWSYPIPQLLL